MPVLPSAASAGQKGAPLLMVLTPLAQFEKSTACIPSTLIRRTRLMRPCRKSLLFWAVAVPIERAAARESRASAFFIVLVTSSTDHMKRSVTGGLIKFELFVKIHGARKWKARSPRWKSRSHGCEPLPGDLLPRCARRGRARRPPPHKTKTLGNLWAKGGGGDIFHWEKRP